MSEFNITEVSICTYLLQTFTECVFNHYNIQSLHNDNDMPDVTISNKYMYILKKGGTFWSNENLFWTNSLFKLLTTLNLQSIEFKEEICAKHILI